MGQSDGLCPVLTVWDRMRPVTPHLSLCFPSVLVMISPEFSTGAVAIRLLKHPFESSKILLPRRKSALIDGHW
ncbi:unnamed protein product [Hymenolepis diminuta]|uniref:Uncharacterized protein n=1 Tax=Hymenolepis diminuta TaxID=6216 RepID=A0A564YQ84_HYMDI|nr:unnamed protein product [Hymenolepis diminuta]